MHVCYRPQAIPLYDAQNPMNQLAMPNTIENNIINQSSSYPTLIHPNLVSIIVEKTCHTIEVALRTLRRPFFFVDLIDHIFFVNIWICMQVQPRPGNESGYSGGQLAPPQIPALFPLHNHISNSYAAWNSMCVFYFYFITLSQLCV